MTSKKIIIIILILLAIISSTLIYWKTNRISPGSGGCEYEKFTDTIKVEKIVYKNDSIDYINFKSIVDSNQIYQEDSWDLSFRIGKDFSEKEIKDTLNKYSINGQRIIKGACTPYSIEEMQLIKK
ncbi:hypothetical protein C8C83_0835 [Flavobacterium sp. 90]|uniref:hypothetical protein n=1 Tax=unclassified Flavobacterium TaxID=196869 RepID=UPI000EAC825D|nr:MULTISPECIES: hypothetical protein [unclassified Flavobacterium]RKR09216.1 hypothetical protein C8C82_1134 [Flavobacterium sp. 81]TCK53000.1 hypothetical protein C8C83_0835 [Flavobacterium sp. 90]